MRAKPLLGIEPRTRDYKALVFPLNYRGKWKTLVMVSSNSKSHLQTISYILWEVIPLMEFDFLHKYYIIKILKSQKNFIKDD